MSGSSRGVCLGGLYAPETQMLAAQVRPEGTGPDGQCSRIPSLDRD